MLSCHHVHRFTVPLLAWLGGALPAQPAEQNEPSLTVVRELFLGGGRGAALAFDPTGTRLASGGSCGEVVVLDARTGAVEHVLEASQQWIGALRFSPDGRRLAVVSQALTLWDLATGQRIASRPVVSSVALDWSRDGRLLACAVEPGYAAVLRAEDLTEVRRFELGDETTTAAVALSPDGARLAIGRPRDLQIHDVVAGGTIAVRRVPRGARGLHYLEDGRLMQLGQRGQHQLFGQRHAIGSRVHGFAVQPDGRRCAVRTNRETVFVYPGDDVVIPGNGPVALHPDGHTWAREHVGHLEVWRDGQQVRRFEDVHRQRIRTAVLTGDGAYVALSNADGQVQVFSVATGSRVCLEGLPSVASLVQFRASPELALRSHRSLQLWSPGAGRLVREVPLPPMEHFVLLKPDRTPRIGHRGRLFTERGRVHDLLDPERAPVEMRCSWATGYRQLLPSPDGGGFIGFTSTAHCTGGGFGSLTLLDRDGRMPSTRAFRRLPRDLDTTPGGTGLFAVQGAVLLFDPPDDIEQTEYPFSWSRLRGIDDRWALGVRTSGLFMQNAAVALDLWRIGAAQPATSLPLRGWCYSLELSADGRRAVVGLQDRALVVDVAR